MRFQVLLLFKSKHVLGPTMLLAVLCMQILPQPADYLDRSAGAALGILIWAIWWTAALGSASHESHQLLLAVLYQSPVRLLRIRWGASVLCVVVVASVLSLAIALIDNSESVPLYVVFERAALLITGAGLIGVGLGALSHPPVVANPWLGLVVGISGGSLALSYDPFLSLLGDPLRSTDFAVLGLGVFLCFCLILLASCAIGLRRTVA